MWNEFAPKTDKWVADYTRSARNVERPRACLIPIAYGDDAWTIGEFERVFRGLGCDTSVLRLVTNDIDLGVSKSYLLAISHEERAELIRRKIRELLLSQDLIYVTGGNTDLLLYMFRRHGIDVILREAYESGIVLFGLSAGAIYVTAGGTTDSSHALALLPLTNGLGWFTFGFDPHHGTDLRRKVFRQLVVEGLLPEKNFAADDGVSLVFKDEFFVEAVADRPDAYAYRVCLLSYSSDKIRRIRESKVKTRSL